MRALGRVVQSSVNTAILDVSEDFDLCFVTFRLGFPFILFGLQF